jgi:copper(I)-binding protein
MISLRSAGFAALTGLLCFAAAAQAPPQPPQTVALLLSNLWTTATPPAAETAGGYLTITNTGTEPDRLIGVSSPLATVGMLHQTQLRDGVASMTMVDGIDVPAGGTVTLAPAGFHVMFAGLKQPLKEGDDFPLTLTFARVGAIETYLHVLAIGSRGPGAAPRGPAI